MDLILNGEPRAIDASDCANLAELVARAEALEGGAGASVVIAVEVDGRALTADELGVLETRPLADVRRVSIVRRPSREVALGVLVQGADYATQIVGVIGETAGHYRAGRTEHASGVLADVLDSLAVLTGITVSISGVLADEARTLAALQGEIQPWLEEMLDAQTEEDPIRIADLLEYEVAPRIEAWGKTMQSLARAQAPVSAGR